MRQLRRRWRDVRNHPVPSRPVSLYSLGTPFKTDHWGPDIRVGHVAASTLPPPVHPQYHTALALPPEATTRRWIASQPPPGSPVLAPTMPPRT